MTQQRYRGQAVVEFALVSVMLVTMVAGAIDFGRAFSAWVALGNMARAGAQYGSVANAMGHDSLAGAHAGMRTAALSEQEGSAIYGVSPQVNAEISDRGGMCTARVELSYQYTPLFNIFGGSFTISRDAEMRGQVLDLCT